MGFLPAISEKALKAKSRRYGTGTSTGAVEQALTDLAEAINPRWQGSPGAASLLRDVA